MGDVSDYKKIIFSYKLLLVASFPIAARLAYSDVKLFRYPSYNMFSVSFIFVCLYAFFVGAIEHTFVVLMYVAGNILLFSSLSEAQKILPYRRPLQGAAKYACVSLVFMLYLIAVFYGFEIMSFDMLGIVYIFAKAAVLACAVSFCSKDQRG